MGLKVTYTDQRTGVEIVDAYVRVTSGSFRKNSDGAYSVSLFVEVFNSTDTSMKAIFSRVIQAGDVDPDQPILASQFYNFLKTLPYFAGAVDADDNTGIPDSVSAPED